MKGLIEAKHLDELLYIRRQDDLYNGSLFNAVYLKVEELLDDMILRNGKILQKEAEGESLERGNFVENIISFQGRRGTGKTSTMLSVYNALKKKDKNKDDGIFLKLKNRDANFIVPEYVDASSLEKGEDILKLVVLNMYVMLKEYEEYGGEQLNYNHRKLYQLLSEVYDSAQNLGMNSNADQELSPLRVLEQLSNSQILRTKMQILVTEFLNYFTRKNRSYVEDNQSFLVIAIDDVDMHLQKEESSAYELLETLHRYLMIPNVIILVSYDYYDLCLGCEKHFYEMFHNSRYISDEDKNHIQLLVIQYLNKILPTYTRINMPSLRKRDYEGDDEINVRIAKNDAELANMLKKFSCFKGEYEDISVKKFAFLLKASVAGLFYDAEGNKRHFAEPLTMRELAQNYIFYKRLYLMRDKYPDNDVEQVNVIYKEIMDDLYFRYAVEKLRRDEYDQFKRYLDVKIERRSHDVLQDLHNCEKAGYDFSIICHVGDKKNSYSYGELLYGLYNASHKGWFSKELICCILDSYTIMLTKIYRKMVMGAHYKSTNKNRLLEIMGASIASSWSNKFLPQYLYGMHAVGGLNSNDDMQKIMIGAVKYSKRITWEFTLKQTKDVDELRKQLQMLEILCMFFTDVVYYEGEKIVKGFRIIYEPVNIGPLKLEGLREGKLNPDIIEFNLDAGCFNIMNFVTNLFREDEYFEDLHISLKSIYKKFFEKSQVDSYQKAEDKEKYVDDFLRGNSIYKEYGEWWDHSKGLALPIYSFDMMYNIFKRYYNDIGDAVSRGTTKDIYRSILTVYEGIGSLLEKENIFYYTGIDKKDKYESFWENYIENPFYVYMKDNKDDVEFKKHFHDMMERAVQIPQV